jgi:hypothetical protein
MKVARGRTQSQEALQWDDLTQLRVNGIALIPVKQVRESQFGASGLSSARRSPFVRHALSVGSAHSLFELNDSGNGSREECWWKQRQGRTSSNGGVIGPRRLGSNPCPMTDS